MSGLDWAGLRAAVGGPECDDGAMSELAADLADVAEQIAVADTLESASLVAAEAACRLVPGVEQASISLAHRGKGIDTLAATAPMVISADLAQVETGQGPCINAAWKDRVARLDDTSTDSTWPAFSARAHDLGVGSMLSFQLSLDDDQDDDDERIGALNCYNSRPRAFTLECVRIGLLLSVHVSVGVSNAERVAHMRRALQTRDVIGQAKGMLMVRYAVGPDEAFAMLVRQSKDTNTPLREVAGQLVRGVTAAKARTAT